MAQTVAHLVDHVMPHVPVRQWVLALSIPLRLLLAALPKRVTPVLQVVHRVITRHLLGQAGVNADKADFWRGYADSTQRISGQLEHSPALPGAGRRVPPQRRWRAGFHGSAGANRRSAADGAALDHHPTDEAAHPQGGVGRRGGFDLHGPTCMARPTWPSATIRTTRACSGRCRLRPALSASPWAHAPSRRC